MTKQDFIAALKAKLREAGLSESFIEKQCSVMETKLDELPVNTAVKYTVESNIAATADKIISKYSEGHSDNPEASTVKQTEDKADGLTVVVDGSTGTNNLSSKTVKSVKKDKSSNTDAASASAVIPSDDEVIVIVDKNEQPKKSTVSLNKARSFSLSFGNEEYLDNAHPKLLFTLLVVLLAPALLLAGIAVFGLFSGVFLALAASIVVIVGVIIGVVGVGMLVSLASLLYGATQIISQPRYVGFHEIGLGLFVAGVTILVSVLLYNVALRLVPYIYSKLITFIGYSLGKVKRAAADARKGCDKL